MDLTGREGLLLVETRARAIQPLTLQHIDAWMSPDGLFVTWEDAGFSILLRTDGGARDVVPTQTWSRITAQGTGIVLGTQEARTMDLVKNDVLDRRELPAAPAGVAWREASDDFSVLATEAAGRTPGCFHDVYVKAAKDVRTIGCHVRVAPDGRVAWTETNRIRGLDAEGNVVNLTEAPGGSADDFTAYENPVFTTDGMAYLRLRGGQTLRSTEVIGPDGGVLARIDGPTRLALHDVSDDGRWVLVTAFTR